jgi:hypothetical protein
MRRVRKFLGLEASEQLLYLKSLLLVSAIRLGLWLLPFKVLQRLSAKMLPTSVKSSQIQANDWGRIATSVQVASRFVPQATCLTQALATQLLLGRKGYPARLQIGVTKNDEGRLQAHAWLESREAVVMGNLTDLSRFQPLRPLL